MYLPHSLYLNLEGTSRLSYIGYLDMLRHGKLERTLLVREKTTPAYLNYAQTLYDYLVGFFNRALPLVDLQKKLIEEEDNFASAWEAGQMSGWEDEKKKSDTPAGEAIWCGFCMSPSVSPQSTTAALTIRSKALLKANGIRRSSEITKAYQEGERRQPRRRPPHRQRLLRHSSIIIIVSG